MGCRLTGAASLRVGLAKMRAGRKTTHQQIVNQLWSFCIDVVKKLCRSDEHLSSQKKSHGLDEMLLSALRQALNVICNQ